MVYLALQLQARTAEVARCVVGASFQRARACEASSCSEAQRSTASPRLGLAILLPSIWTELCTCTPK
jgi:hypothetical protein